MDPNTQDHQLKQYNVSLIMTPFVNGAQAQKEGWAKSNFLFFLRVPLLHQNVSGDVFFKTKMILSSFGFIPVFSLNDSQKYKDKIAYISVQRLDVSLNITFPKYFNI